MTEIKTFAPAKINLYLHVTGRRPNGYHELDSLVAFCNVGDLLSLQPAESFSFAVEGPFGEILSKESSEDNLVVRAARELARRVNRPLDMRLTLTKNLPLASGIGGGSTDAAAVLRLLARYWALLPNHPILHETARTLGQDIPCCIQRETCYFCGIGDVTEKGPDLPETYIVLANPLKALSTPSVFRAREGGFSAEKRLPYAPKTSQELADFLRERSNDLTTPACKLLPEIHEVLAALQETEKSLLTRMSGSGATCFALYPDERSSKIAAAKVAAQHPGWWVSPAFLPKNRLMVNEPLFYV